MEKKLFNLSRIKDNFEVGKIAIFMSVFLSCLILLVAVFPVADAAVHYPPGSLLQPEDVTSSHIRNGTIVDEDVNASAAIAWSKIDKTGSSLADLATVAFSDTTGTVDATRGGTGLTSCTAGDLITATGTNTFSNLAKGTANQVLGMNSGATTQEYKTLTAGAGIQITHGANSVTIGTTGNDSTSSLLTAEENLAAGDAVCIAPYISNGGVTINTTVEYYNGTAGTTNTQSVTVGANSNRGLLVFAGIDAGHTLTGITYAGQAMTLVGAGGNALQIYYLNAPATGANNLVMSVSSINASLEADIYSIYNVKQTGQPEAESHGTGSSGAVTTIAAGADVFGSVSGSTPGASGWYFADKLTTSNLKSGRSTLVPTSRSVSSSFSSNTYGVVSFAPYTAEAAGDIRKCSSNTATTQYYNLYEGFMGFSAAAITAGNTGSIKTSGLATGLSGLTAGKQYYLNNTAGTIGISAGTVSRKVCIAFDATSCVVTNIW